MPEYVTQDDPRAPARCILIGASIIASIERASLGEAVLRACTAENQAGALVSVWALLEDARQNQCPEEGQIADVPYPESRRTLSRALDAQGITFCAHRKEESLP